MSWRVVVRTDILTAIRAKITWLLALLFVVLAGGRSWTLPSYIADQRARSPKPGFWTVDTAHLADVLVGSVIGLGSLIAIVVSHRALAGERETGTIKLLLTSPHSRHAVFLGKFVSRSIVALVPILAGLLLAGVIGLGRHTQFSPVTFLQFVTLTVSFVIAFVSVALALSTTTASGNEATAGAFGCYLVLGVGWPASTTLVKSVRNLVVEGTFTDTPQGQFENPDWFGLLDIASPAGAYRRLAAQWVQELPVSMGLTWEQSAPVAVITLAVWIILPAILGYRRFNRLDLC